ncbi:uncharacterized protein LOC126265631 [Aethina tumida]|uniref:uncharacterized protein LOC126265631 n=1 Tax=Aethina tumida TaxID=116153 RepID=UPI002147FD31|nr:uncharacterized protein LOC126265631 [Aethina tumida]
MFLICLGGFLDYTANKYVNEPTKINSEFSVFLRVAPILSICLGILLHLNIFINFVISQNYKFHIILNTLMISVMLTLYLYVSDIFMDKLAFKISETLFSLYDKANSGDQSALHMLLLIEADFKCRGVGYLTSKNKMVPCDTVTYNFLYYFNFTIIAVSFSALVIIIYNSYLTLSFKNQKSKSYYKDYSEWAIHEIRKLNSNIDTIT